MIVPTRPMLFSYSLSVERGVYRHGLTVFIVNLPMGDVLLSSRLYLCLESPIYLKCLSVYPLFHSVLGLGEIPTAAASARIC